MTNIIQTRNDEAGFIEFLNDDIATIVREIDGPCAILLDMNTRQVVGYRVYDPVPIDGKDLQTLLRLKEDNVWDGVRPVLENPIADEMRRAFSLSERGLIALEQVARGVRLHITRKGVVAISSAMKRE